MNCNWSSSKHSIVHVNCAHAGKLFFTPLVATESNIKCKFFKIYKKLVLKFQFLISCFVKMLRKKQVQTQSIMQKTRKKNQRLVQQANGI